MSYNPRRSKSVIACVEMMEARQLLSASLSPAAHKAPPTIPSIVDDTFTGTDTALGHQFSLSVTFETETAKGAFTASIDSDGETFGSTGSVKSTRAITIEGKVGKVRFVLHGTLNAALDTLSGRYTDTTTKGSISGPFSLTKTVPA
jgi:hypothetical protein